ncbi:GNAT family N-acetyltransferase [Kribbella sp. NBC_01245]|uniref:GNAT family N-acetyltransferase n=1 Tax=Kribbella sp. NBC_01245 TaxID=2903578 RepID=UPI002E2B229D|nr:GNAT family N-acetyltransferase [Kribbella sp. NBC_01245]
MKTAVRLPDHYTVRPPEPGDAEAIFGLLSAYNTAVIGVADCALEPIAECIVEPGFDRGTDGWLVLTDDGLPVGYATAFGKGDRQVVEVEVASQDPVVAEWLFDEAMRRAREMGRERGHGEITVDSCVYRADEPLRALFFAHDFVTGTTYHRMRIDHTAGTAVPKVPAGVVVRRGAFDDAARWAAHEVIIESFRGQFGFVARPHDEWVACLEAKSAFDWSQLTLLEVDGRGVAVRTCGDEFVEGENCGHIGTLCVIEEFRGQGLAKFLLHDAFAIDAAAGRAGTILNVDTNNPTPALGLYLSAGMNPVLIFDGLRRVLPTT